MDILETQKAVHLTAQQHGWWDTADDCNVPTKLALVHSEVSEALEDYRTGGTRLDLMFMSRDPETGKLKRITPTEATEEAYADPDGAPLKPVGFGIELADAIIRIMDLAEWMDIDLAHHIQVKMNYNQSRPMRHGGKKV
jgi:hypothetical protein